MGKLADELPLKESLCLVKEATKVWGLKGEVRAIRIGFQISVRLRYLTSYFMTIDTYNAWCDDSDWSRRRGRNVIVHGSYYSSICH